jgi:hypothetical protein
MPSDACMDCVPEVPTLQFVCNSYFLVVCGGSSESRSLPGGRWQRGRYECWMNWLRGFRKAGIVWLLRV